MARQRTVGRPEHSDDQIAKNLIPVVKQVTTLVESISYKNDSTGAHQGSRTPDGGVLFTPIPSSDITILEKMHELLINELRVYLTSITARAMPAQTGAWEVMFWMQFQSPSKGTHPFTMNNYAQMIAQCRSTHLSMSVLSSSQKGSDLWYLLYGTSV